MYYNQGDQIGRIFAQLLIVYFGQFSENYKSYPQFRGYFYPRLRWSNNFDKIVLGYILGDLIHSLIWTQSYDRELQRQRCKFLQRYG
jgi:hypothetical protein